MPVTTTWTSAAAGGTLDLSNGQVVTETHWDALVSNLNHVGGTNGWRGASGSRSTAQSISSGSATPITLTNEEFDTDAIFTPTSATISAPVTGLYLIVGYADFAANSTGLRSIYIHAATGDRGQIIVPAVTGDATKLTVAHVMSLTSGQTAEMRALQTSGGALNVNAAILTLVKV